MALGVRAGAALRHGTILAPTGLIHSGRINRPKSDTRMTLDYATLDLLRQSHPARRLLGSALSALVASFLNRVFVVPPSFRHRVLASNEIPETVWVDSFDAALALTGKRREASRFAGALAATRREQPASPALIRPYHAS